MIKQLSILSLLALSSTAAMANNSYSEVSVITKAKITSVTPQYEIIEKPTRTCTVETVTEYKEEPQVQAQANVGAAILGGIAGAAVGSQVGGGSGKKAATVAGAIGGAMLGNHLGGQANAQAGATTPQRKQVERCVEGAPIREKNLSGYTVQYNANGVKGEYFSASKPIGTHIDVRLTASPVGF